MGCGGRLRLGTADVSFRPIADVGGLGRSKISEKDMVVSAHDRRVKLHWTIRASAAAFAVLTCGPALACNTEGYEFPWDFEKADKVLAGRITNYRLVANEPEGVRLKRAIETGAADSYQRELYERRVSNGLPPGGRYGLFDFTVKEVLKGKSARKLTVIFPDEEWLGQPGHQSMLPNHLPNQDVVVGLNRQKSALFHHRANARIITDGCYGVMLTSIGKDSSGYRMKMARGFFRAKSRR